MILPFPDETLHSLIIRGAMLEVGTLRLKDLKGVISYNGYWINYPQVGSESFLADYPKELVYEFILKRLPAVGCFCSPSQVELTLIFKNLFDRKGFFYDEFIFFNCDSWQSPVRYCSECFKDMLYHYGVCYFKCSWYKFSICNIHNSKLTKVKAIKNEGRKSNIYSEIYKSMKVL